MNFCWINSLWTHSWMEQFIHFLLDPHLKTRSLWDRIILSVSRHCLWLSTELSCINTTIPPSSSVIVQSYIKSKDKPSENMIRGRNNLYTNQVYLTLQLERIYLHIERNWYWRDRYELIKTGQDIFCKNHPFKSSNKKVWRKFFSIISNIEKKPVKVNFNI